MRGAVPERGRATSHNRSVATATTNVSVSTRRQPLKYGHQGGMRRHPDADLLRVRMRRGGPWPSDAIGLAGRSMASLAVTQAQRHELAARGAVPSYAGGATSATSDTSSLNAHHTSTKRNGPACSRAVHTDQPLVTNGSGCRACAVRGGRLGP